ncbi:MAG: PEGA domain-containing protein [Kofleriaceae bacterium]
MRLAAGIALGVCAAGTAFAGPTRKVTVESTPPGATVYINDIDSGAACDATPCTIDAPIGSSTIIFRKEGFNPEITSLDVPKRGKVKTIKATLTGAVGTIVVEDAAFKGAKVLVDNEDKGAAPQRIEVDAGPHTVAVMLKGQKVGQFAGDVEAGDETVVKFEKPEGGGSSSAPQPPKVAKLEIDSGDDDGEAKPQGVLKARAEQKRSDDAGPHAPWLNLGADLDVGFRQFAYDHAANGLSPTENESGQSMIGPTLELWPMVLADSEHLRGLSLFGKVGFGVNHQAILDSMNQPVGPTTFWGTIEADLRHRWNIGGSSVALQGGFTRDQLQFQAASKMDLSKVPVADYRSIQLGVRGTTMLGSLEAFADIDGRIVLSGGDLAKRFASADISGIHAALGFQYNASFLYVRAQAAITYYSWTFTNAGTDATAGTADGASDKIEVLSFVVGLSH